ncbi:MAG: hypothetical protein V7631_3852 [Massilia sp.]|jgi:hypothetical protein
MKMKPSTQLQLAVGFLGLAAGLTAQLTMEDSWPKFVVVASLFFGGDIAVWRIGRTAKAAAKAAGRA